VSTPSTIRATLRSLESGLGSEAFRQFKAFGRRWVIRQMMPSDAFD
jgi:hypothetical protein